MFGRSASERAARERAAEGDALEPLIAECLERYAERGAAAVEELCRAHPAHAARIQRRIESLARIGMLDGEPELAAGGPDASAPASFGGYRILRRLGQGGMATVYLARDEQRGRDVALKVGQPAGERSRRRFEREIRAVRELEHPNVVPVLDVGEAEGRAYFTMELARGATLAQVIEDLRRAEVPPAELSSELVQSSVRERAREMLDGVATDGPGNGTASGEDAWGRTYVETICRLALDVARALAHAHARGIVHRDVKPSNVLVREDGRALLFDFGLARVEDDPALTRSGDFAGTPYYVSPEQVAGRAGDVDRRTDVYSLGVTLYELATLRRPFEGKSSPEIFRAIETREPLAPRRANPDLPRDLETICLTAMEKDPARRYASADEMAADLERFLEFRPVVARPIGALRRMARAARRDPALSAAAALGAFVLVGAPIGLLWANARIREQRDRASDAALEARRQAALNAEQLEFLVELFRAGGEREGASRDADNVTARELLDRGVQRIPREFSGDPLVRAALMEATGRVYKNLGLYEKALPLFDRAFAIRHRELGEDHRDVASVLLELSEVHLASENLGAALALGQRSLVALERSGSGRTLAAARCRAVLGRASRKLGQLDAAEEHLLAARAILREDGRAAPEDEAAVLEDLAGTARDRGARELAAQRFEEALALRRQAWTPDPAALARTLDELALERESLGDARAAEARDEARSLRAGLALASAGAPAREPLASAPDSAALPSAFDLVPPWKHDFDELFQTGITALQSGEYERARTAFERGLALAPRHPACAYNLTCAHALAGDADRALDWLERAADFGFPFSDERFEIVLKDADLDRLRPLPRFGALLQRMRAMREAAQRYASEPAVFVPRALEGEASLPLLVVLHAEGSTKDQLVAGEWRSVAERAGAVLLAPSGARPTADDPRRGTCWFEDLAAFLEDPARHEREIGELVRAYCDTNPVDRERVLIAGDGLGALLAFDLAVRAPGLFRGVLVHHGPFGAGLDPERARAASSMGLAVEVVLERDAALAGRPAGEDAAATASALEEWLAHAGLGAHARVHAAPAGAAPAERVERLASSVRALLR